MVRDFSSLFLEEDTLRKLKTWRIRLIRKTTQKTFLMWEILAVDRAMLRSSKAEAAVKSLCQTLVSWKDSEKEFFQIVTVFPELCKWGPSCATILREQFPHCDYDCATCTLHGSNGEGANENEEVEAVEVDQVVGQVGGWACFKFVENRGISPLISSDFLSPTRYSAGHC